MIAERHRHAFGRDADSIDVGSGHFIRPIHELVRYDEPIGMPVLPRPDTPVIGLMWWHACPAQEPSWLTVYAPAGEILECPFCGDRGRIRGGRWVKVKAAV
jgi:hypothetical protein